MYWSDYACPFCYIGVTNLKNAVKKMGLQDVRLEMKAFELDPELKSKHGETIIRHLVEKYGETEDTIRGRIENITKMGAQSGLDLHYADAKCSSTFDAHRITKMAQKKGDYQNAERLIERLYKAYFIDGMDLANHKNLMMLATEAGFHELEVAEVLNSDLYGDDVRREEYEAYQSGVSGVPYFIFENFLALPGALQEKEMISVLKEVIKSSGDINLMNGESCEPDGCTI